MKSGIYRIKNIITNDCYVGSSINIEKRWREHQRALKRNKHRNPKLQNAYNKYGVDSFKYEIFEICPVEFLLEREQERLDSGAFSYNICMVAGNTAGRKASDETKAKLSAAKKGEKHSDETKAKICASNKGKKRSAETKAKISASASKMRKPLSEEHKAKLSAVGKGRVFSEETKAKISAAKMSAARKAYYANLKKDK